MSKFGGYLFGVSAICLFILSIPLSAASLPVPQPVLDYQKAARDCIAQADPAGAVVSYQRIQHSFPDTIYATDAQCQIVNLYLQTGQKDKTAESLTELKRNFASRPEYVKLVHELGWEFVKKQDYATAIEIYKDLQAQFPNHERAVWFQRSIVQVYLEQGDIDKVKQAVGDLENNFQSHPDYANQMMMTADRLCGKKQYAIAGEIYDYLLENLPDDKDVVVWKRMQIQNLLDTGQISTAKAAVEVLFSDYQGTPAASASLKASFIKQVHELGGEFGQKKDYETALRIYNGLLEQFPNDERALWFARSIAQAYLEQGDMKKVKQAVENLKSNFQSHPDYANQMEKLAGNLIDKNQLAEAKGVCETLIEKFPDHSRLPWFLQAKARSEVWMKDPNSADVTAAVMQQKYDAKDPNYADAMSWTAYEYRGAGYYQRAIELYEWLLKQNPAPKVQLRSIANIAQACARLGDDAKVQEKVDYLLSHFKDNPEGIAFYMFGIGEEYYNKAFMNGKQGRLAENSSEAMTKAIEIWQKPVYPEGSKQKVDALFLTAMAYQYLRQYEAAIETYGKIMDLKADGYAGAGNILRLIGNCYEGMAYYKLGDPNEATAGAETAWQTVLEKYPDNPMSFDAAMRLAQVKERKGQWNEAAEAYEFFLSHCGKDIRKVRTTFKLGQAYEQAGQKDLAREAYSEYVQEASVGDPDIPQAAKALLRLAEVK